MLPLRGVPQPNNAAAAVDCSCVSGGKQVGSDDLGTPFLQDRDSGVEVGLEGT